MNTLKSIQGKGEEDFDNQFVDKSYDINGNYAYCEFNDVNLCEDVKAFIHQQTTLAYNAGKVDYKYMKTLNTIAITLIVVVCIVLVVVFIGRN